MKCPFTLKPKHWWFYLNPFWWRRKKTFEGVMAYYWYTEDMETKILKAIMDLYLFGEGRMRIEWSKEDE